MRFPRTAILDTYLAYALSRQSRVLKFYPIHVCTTRVVFEVLGTRPKGKLVGDNSTHSAGVGILLATSTLNVGL